MCENFTKTNNRLRKTYHKNLSSCNCFLEENNVEDNIESLLNRRVPDYLKYAFPLIRKIWEKEMEKNIMPLEHLFYSTKTFNTTQFPKKLTNKKDVVEFFGNLPLYSEFSYFKERWLKVPSEPKQANFTYNATPLDGGTNKRYFNSYDKVTFIDLIKLKDFEKSKLLYNIKIECIKFDINFRVVDGKRVKTYSMGVLMNGTLLKNIGIQDIVEFSGFRIRPLYSVSDGYILSITHDLLYLSDMGIKRSLTVGDSFNLRLFKKGKFGQVHLETIKGEE